MAELVHFGKKNSDWFPERSEFSYMDRLKEFRIATTFLQNMKDFQGKLEYLKNNQAFAFSELHIVIHFHPGYH